MTLRQKEPRIEDPGHLKAVRRLPCIVCGKHGLSDAAHIRSGSLVHKKRHTGFGEKPDDKWTLPLCRDHHREQHSMNELAFWRLYRINPFAAAKRLYGKRVPPKPATPKPRRPKSSRRPAGKPLKSRNEWPAGRKLTGRNDLSRKATP
jgi:hypothetical protein